jgi:hypothetical protein
MVNTQVNNKAHMAPAQEAMTVATLTVPLLLTPTDLTTPHTVVQMIHTEVATTHTVLVPPMPMVVAIPTVMMLVTPMVPLVTKKPLPRNRRSIHAHKSSIPYPVAVKRTISRPTTFN